MPKILGSDPSMAVSTNDQMVNLKVFGLLRIRVPKKIKPFNIVYVNFHCGRRDRLLESCKVEGVVPLFGQWPPSQGWK